MITAALQPQPIRPHNRRPDEHQLAQRRIRPVRLHLEVRAPPVASHLTMPIVSGQTVSQPGIQNGRPDNMPVVQLPDLSQPFCPLALTQPAEVPRGIGIGTVNRPGIRGGSNS